MKQVDEEHLKKLSHKMKVYFALFCANQVREHWKDIPECVEAIRITELWLEGKASSEECRVAAHAAHAANAANAAYAAYAAANAANAAYAAANAAYAVAHAANANKVKSKVIEKQWDYYNELLNFDENFEKVVLGEQV